MEIEIKVLTSEYALRKTIPFEVKYNDKTITGTIVDEFIPVGGMHTEDTYIEWRENEDTLPEELKKKIESKIFDAVKHVFLLESFMRSSKNFLVILNLN